MAESIAVLAAAGGAAVVQAAGTDAWAAVSGHMRELFIRQRDGRSEPGLMLLDRMAAELSTAQAAADRLRARAQWEEVWRRYLEAWLEGLAGAERTAALRELQEVVVAGGGPAREAGRVQARRDIVVRAENGSVAGGALQVEGGIHLSGPFSPPPEAGR